MQSVRARPVSLLSCRRAAILIAVLFAAIILYSAATFIVYNQFSIGSRHFDLSAVPGVPYSDVSFPARGQQYLVHAFYVPGQPEHGALIDIPGYNMSRHDVYHLRRSEGLHALGYTVLAVDLSDSNGDTVQNGRISFGYSERNDVLGAFDFLLAKGFNPGRIGLVGESMGAATSLLAAADEPRIKAVWADSPFKDATSLFLEVSGRRGVPAFLVPGAELWSMLIGGERIWESRPIMLANTLAQQRQAITLVATRGDTTVPFHNGSEIYEAYRAAGAEVSFWDLPDLEHVKTIEVYFDDYMRRLDAFFRKSLT